MTSQIKITQLSDIGNSIANTTLVPVVNMTGVSTTQKATMGNIANSILAGAGTAYQNANIANIALSVANAAQPNITSLGTLSVNTLKITGGSTDQVLSTDGAGNLSWVAQSGGGNANTGDIGFDNNVIYSNGGVVVNNSDLGNGQTAGMSIPIQGDGNSVSLYNTYGNVTLLAGNIGNSQNVQSWSFGADGNLNLPDGTILQNGGGIEYPVSPGYEWDLHSSDGKVYIGSVSDMAYIDTYDANISVRLRTNGANENDWIFDPTGNLTLPDVPNPSINYANGSPYGGGNANTGNVTFDNQIVIGTGDPYGGGGLYLAQGPDSVANLQYFIIRGGDNETHLHFDTGNNQFYDQYFGDDSKYVKLEAAGNVKIGTADAISNSAQWTFGVDGALTLPAGDIITDSVQTVIISGAGTAAVNQTYEIIETGQYVGLTDNDYQIDTPEAPSTTYKLRINTEAGGYYESEDLITWTIVAGAGGGTAPVPTGVIVPQRITVTVDSSSWQFGADGNLTLPNDATISDSSNVASLNAGGNTRFAQLYWNGNIGNGNPYDGSDYYTWAYISNVGFTIQHLNNNTSTDNEWNFGIDGNLRTPGNVDIYGSINFPQQVSNINWSTYNIELSQYGRINTNVDFFANANVIGAQYLKGDGSNISNINASNITNAYSDSNVISLLGDLGGNGISNVGNIDISGNINFTNNSAVQQSSIVVNPFRTIETVTLSANSQNNATLLTLEDTGNANLRAWQDINLNTYTQTTNNNFNFGANGNLTIPGNISGSGANGLMISSNGNVTLNSKGAEFIFDAPAGNFYLPNPGGAIVFADSSVQNTAYTGSIAGANVSGQVGNALVAGTVYTNAQPNITSVGTLLGLSVTGNVSANNFTGNGSQLTGIPTQTTGNWELVPGVNTANISVPLNGTYSIWVKGNIPNGIVTYIATAVITNTNVPVLGEQYGWYYLAGNALVLTSIPNQFVGTPGVISNAAPYSGNTANVFTFGITNNSGANAVVNWGYTKL